MHRRTAITEWSFFRAYLKFLRSGFGSFAIITSWRSKVPREGNIHNWGSFESAVSGAAHGYVELNGMGMEKDEKTGKQYQAWEPSLWIHGIALPSVHSLASRYDQDAFIYSGPETGGAVTLCGDGNHKTLGSFTPAEPLSAAEIKRYWSEWRKRPFRVIQLRHPVQNNVEGLGYEAMINDWARKRQRAAPPSRGRS
jgi:hypothetical protein